MSKERNKWYLIADVKELDFNLTLEMKTVDGLDRYGNEIFKITYGKQIIRKRSLTEAQTEFNNCLNHALYLNYIQHEVKK